MTVRSVGTLSRYMVDLAAPTGNESVYLLVRCPICDDYLDIELTRSSQKVVDDHIANHDPEELGLGEGDRRYRPLADIMIDTHGLSPHHHGDRGAYFRHREPRYQTFDLDGEAVAEAVGVVAEEPYQPIAAKHADVLGVLAEIEPAGSEEIAERLDYATSTVQNRTYELKAAGWIERAGKGHRGRVLFTLSTTDSYDHLFAREYPEVVELIRNHGSVSANTIAERLGMGRSAARARIDNLEAEGSIEFVGEGYRGCHLYSTTESLEGEL